MKTITAADAAADLRRLLDEVANGETFVITSDEAPIARVVPASDPVRVEAPGDRDIVREWEDFRREHNITLGGGITIREMIDEGRK